MYHGDTKLERKIGRPRVETHWVRRSEGRTEETRDSGGQKVQVKTTRNRSVVMPTTEYEYDNGTNMSDLGER